MSIVAVHGPNTFGSKAVKSAGPVTATVDPADGTIWTFTYNGGSTRPATDFVWSYTPAGGAPASPINSVLTTGAIDFTTTGDKVVTLTVANSTDTITNKALTNNVATLTTSAPHGLSPGNVVTISGITTDTALNGTFTLLTGTTGSTVVYACVNANVTSAASGGTISTSSGLPAAGAYPITVTAVTGTGGAGSSLRSVLPGGDEEEGPFDPGDHTIPEVEEYVTANPDQAQAVYDLEVEGKARVTLVTWLEDFEA